MIRYGEIEGVVFTVRLYVWSKYYGTWIPTGDKVQIQVPDSDYIGRRCMVNDEIKRLVDIDQ